MGLVKFLLLLFINYQPVTVPQDDLLDDIAIWLKTSNSQELSKNFSSTIQLTILDDDDSFSKAQAEQVLKSFFSKYKPTAGKIIHTLTSNPNYKLAVVSLNTEKGMFRVSCSLKNTGGKFLITEMRFEAASK